MLVGSSMTIEVSKEKLVVELDALKLDWGDQEDAEILVCLLLEHFTVLQAWTWLAWYDDELGGMPILLLKQGRSRDVFAAARALCRLASS